MPYDPESYQLRNLIELAIGHLKEYRRVAMRFDKLDTSYLSIWPVHCAVASF